MDSKTRVMLALDHKQPDRIPYFDPYWPEFVEVWKKSKNVETTGNGTDVFDPDTPSAGSAGDVNLMLHYEQDIAVCVADESPWPSMTKFLRQDDNDLYNVDGWGRTIRTRTGAYFLEVEDTHLKDRVDPDKLKFESPREDCRYDSFLASIEESRKHYCVFAKTGGPLLRTANLRGQMQFFMDMAEDPEWTSAIAGRCADHMTEVGIESMRRGNCFDTGIWIYDDMASNIGPMVSPDMWERIFYPHLARMARRYKEAGAKKIVFHSDGNIMPVMEHLIEAGIDAIDPVEPKAGMEVNTIREKFGHRIAFVGGGCNAIVLPRGDKHEIREEVKRVLRAGKDGGLVIGTHSIGPDISIEAYEYWVSCFRELGNYPLDLD